MTWADTEDFHTLSERSHTEKATGSTKSLEQASPRRQNDASTAGDWQGGGRGVTAYVEGLPLGGWKHPGTAQRWWAHHDARVIKAPELSALRGRPRWHEHYSSEGWP